MEEFRETLFNFIFHCLLHFTKEPSREVHLFLSKVLICIFKHSTNALPLVAAQWLMFKRIFAFEKNCEKEENMHLIKEMPMRI